MPKANWEIDADVIDDFDRESQYTPYTGSVPPNAVYQWRIKVATYKPGDRSRKPQLSVGLELVPRSRDEKQYEGFFAWKNAFPTEKNAFTYAPFCDAIGVSGKDFVNRTITDEEGNIKRIGAWKNDGTTLILGQLEDNVWTTPEGTTRQDKKVGWVGPADVEEEPEDDDEDLEDYEDVDTEDDEFE